MKLKTKKPTSSGVRHQIRIQKNLLAKKNQILKNSIIHIKKNSGRSSKTGNITVHHIGGGNKKNYKRKLTEYQNSVYLIISINYDQNKNCFFSLIFNPFLKHFSFISTGENHCVGTLIESGFDSTSNKTGNFLQLQQISAGTLINNISLKNKLSVFACSAGTFAQIIQKSFTEIKLRLPSGQTISVAPQKSFGYLGVVSNKKQNLTFLGKAGKNRLIHKRPSVRGCAMNPVDHPHGGRTNKGGYPVSPWGKLTKGVPTKK